MSSAPSYDFVAFEELCFRDDPLSMEKHGVKVMTHQQPGVPMIVKGRGIIKAPVKEVLAIVSSPEQRSKWDTFCQEAKLVEKTSEEVMVVYMKTKAQMMVSARDFLIRGQINVKEDGTTFILMKDFESETYPPVSGCVRASALQTGFALRPQNEGKETEIVYLLQIDLKGWIPTSLVNKVNEQQPLGILGIRKLATGNVEE